VSNVKCMGVVLKWEWGPWRAAISGGLFGINEWRREDKVIELVNHGVVWRFSSFFLFSLLCCIIFIFFHWGVKNNKWHSSIRIFHQLNAGTWQGLLEKKYNYKMLRIGSLYAWALEPTFTSFKIWFWIFSTKILIEYLKLKQTQDH